MNKKEIYYFGAVFISIAMITCVSSITAISEEKTNLYDETAIINPIKNPGTYQFKSGLCGKNNKNGKEIKFLGQFEAYKNPLNFFLVKFGDKLLSHYRRRKEIVHGLD